MFLVVTGDAIIALLAADVDFINWYDAVAGNAVMGLKLNDSPIHLGSSVKLATGRDCDPNFW